MLNHLLGRQVVFLFKKTKIQSGKKRYNVTGFFLAVAV
jgi:hypothetical protein